MPCSDDGQASRRVMELVREFQDRRQDFLEIVCRHGSPLYVLDESVLVARAAEFVKTFRGHVPGIELFYPVKANSHPHVLSTLVGVGAGIEVSSGLELCRAIAAGAREIVFNGPGKTDDELRLAIAHEDRVTIILDSPTEMERLESLAGSEGKVIRAGVRLAVGDDGGWRKFGIPVDELPSIMERAAGCGHVDLRGLHFHTSWNRDPSAQVRMIGRIGGVIQTLPDETRGRIDFMDIGGGFWPPQGEWLPTPDTTTGGSDRSAAGDGQAESRARFFKVLPAAPLEQFAREISQALRKHVFPFVSCRILAEPGRWICTDAMHLLLTVIDVKGGDIAITDGGTNAVGWERFEQEYFPVINLTRPDETERPFHVLGSLCTPQDRWGSSYFGKDIRPGDIMAIPHQGAYVYSLRQNFIKPLPRVVTIREGQCIPLESEDH